MLSWITSVAMAWRSVLGAIAMSLSDIASQSDIASLSDIAAVNQMGYYLNDVAFSG